MSMGQAATASHPFSSPLLAVWDTFRLLCVAWALVQAFTCVVLAVNHEGRPYTPATSLGLITQAIFICVILGTELVAVGRTIVWWRLPMSLLGLAFSTMSVRKLIGLPVRPRRTWRPGRADVERE